jgi:cytochrome c-type biogenesis protein CcmF
VVSVYRDGKYLAELHPRIDFYFDAQQTMTIPGQYSTLADDLYVLLVDWQPVSAEQATFKVYHNPLVNWLWLGALVFIAAILIAAWPQPEMEVLPVRAADRSPLRVGASD